MNELFFQMLKFCFIFLALLLKLIRTKDFYWHIRSWGTDFYKWNNVFINLINKNIHYKIIFKIIL